MDRARFAFAISIMWGAAILAGIIAVYLTITGPAAAQELQCGNWEEVKTELDGKGFHKAGFGLIADTVALAILEDEGGEHWYMFSVNANGTACLIQTGTSWTPFPEPEPLVPGRRPA
jgi:hypothetical protein